MLHTSSRHPPSDARYNRNPGPVEYFPRYNYVHGYRTQPSWTIPPIQYWRHTQHPETGGFVPGSITWNGGKVQRLERHKTHDPLDPRGDENAPLPPFFRMSVPAYKNPPLDSKVRTTWSADGTRLSRYRKTMEVVGQESGRRRAPIPTPQVNSKDEFMSKYHPHLMLPDPALVTNPRLRASLSRPCSQQSSGSKSSSRSLRLPAPRASQLDTRCFDNPLNEG